MGAGHGTAVTLLSDKDDLTEEAWKYYAGGRSALVVQATSYPTTLNFQMKGPDGNPITLNSSTINADGVTSYDLPAGEYRMELTGGTATDVYAVISRVTY